MLAGLLKKLEVCRVAPSSLLPAPCSRLSCSFESPGCMWQAAISEFPIGDNGITRPGEFIFTILESLNINSWVPPHSSITLPEHSAIHRRLTAEEFTPADRSVRQACGSHGSEPASLTPLLLWLRRLTLPELPLLWCRLQVHV